MKTLNKLPRAKKIELAEKLSDKIFMWGKYLPDLYILEARVRDSL